ncbi:MAG: hypothetical protein JJT90_18950 [Ectothiorhodospiraceae bacterium]|nr:hypothetical protein [Ectothiorhodospiraceae bacterium]
MIHRRLHHRAAALLFTALLVTATAPAGAAEPLNGYRSTAFGMSADEVWARMEDDGVIGTATHETEDGDLIIDARLEGDAPPETGVRYVFPGGHDRLALILEFHPDPSLAEGVRARLSERHGEPWDEELAEQWFERLRGDMPEGVQALTVWGGDDGNRNRFIRLWVFDDYVSVEYLDLELLAGAP